MTHCAIFAPITREVSPSHPKWSQFLHSKHRTSHCRNTRARVHRTHARPGRWDHHKIYFLGKKGEKWNLYCGRPGLVSLAFGALDHSFFARLFSTAAHRDTNMHTLRQNEDSTPRRSNTDHPVRSDRRKRSGVQSWTWVNLIPLTRSFLSPILDALVHVPRLPLLGISGVMSDGSNGQSERATDCADGTTALLLDHTRYGSLLKTSGANQHGVHRRTSWQSKKHTRQMRLSVLAQMELVFSRVSLSLSLSRSCPLLRIQLLLF